MANNRHKPWDRRTPSGRIIGILERRKLLILCEDEKSSCLYFKGFPLDAKRVEVITVGTGRNTDSLVIDAIRRKTLADELRQPFNDVWCVFDRDDFPAENFNRAFELADKHGIRLAWSNEAFELWYLLHFNYHDTGMSRKEYGSRLNELLKCRYDKSDPTIYQKITAHQRRAIANARKLEAYWNQDACPNPERNNPSTSVHKLVELLNEYVEIGSAEPE